MLNGIFSLKTAHLFSCAFNVFPILQSTVEMINSQVILQTQQAAGEYAMNFDGLRATNHSSPGPGDFSSDMNKRRI